ncbi:MAG: rhomboid family intramembrane serine protease [Firmicutes bacterium]|nr:rhomboid family intramembrane serine protease [Bacillota bacterium]
MERKPILETMWNYIKKFPVTSVIIILNLAMLLLTIFSGGFTNENLYSLGALVPAAYTASPEFYRILTGMFLHGSIFHFLSNMFVLYVLGTALEKSLGPLRFFALYMLSGIGSGIAVMFLSSSLTIGASGAIWGVIGSLLVITFVRPYWFTPRSVQSIRSLMVLNLVITFLIPNVSIAGHIGGLVSGGLLILLLLPKKPYFLRNVREFYNGHEVVGDGDANIVS